MPDRHILAGVQQALAAIDVMLRNGRMQTSVLVTLACEARQSAELASQKIVGAKAADAPAGQPAELAKSG
jgi:hypothetical protein